MTRIALSDASGPLTDLLQKLSGENGAAWLRNLNKFLRGELMAKPVFPTWRTIRIGNYSSMEELSKTLRSKHLLNRWSWVIGFLKKIAVASTEAEIELVNVSGRDLGFEAAVSRSKIYHRAKDLGLDCVPAEVAPQLRLQHPDQLHFEELFIAMQPIEDSCGLTVLTVIRGDGNPYLGWASGDPDCLWSPDYRLIFTRGKQTQPSDTKSPDTAS